VLHNPVISEPGSIDTNHEFLLKYTVFEEFCEVQISGGTPTDKSGIENLTCPLSPALPFAGIAGRNGLS
jgi:hypothetical protein